MALVLTAMPCAGEDKDAHFVYDCWGTDPRDDGTNDQELMWNMFAHVDLFIETVRKNEGDVANASGRLLLAMLELRAYGDQRKATIHLRPYQKEQLALVRKNLESSNLYYQAKPDQLQSLCDFCRSKEGASMVERLKVMAGDKAFDKKS